MAEMIANWPFVVAAALVLLALAWLLLRRRDPARRERHHAPDALDQGAAAAQRNQALIDAPSAASASQLAATGPDILGGIGEVVAAAAASEVLAARNAETRVAPRPPQADTNLRPPQADTNGDDLTRLKGVGRKLSALLAELGVDSFAQIASWTEADIAAIDAKLGSFAGRPARDQWVEQAGFLAKDDIAGFEAKFGKL